MKIHEFASYAEYIAAQREVTLRKLSREIKCFTTIEVAKVIAAGWAGFGRGLCHGVQGGGELDLFRQAFGGGEWLGTDIVKEAADRRPDVVCHDFQMVRQDWVGHWDLIYSNALDHATRPFETLRVWMSCLRRDGRLYIEWTPWHNRLSRHGMKSDCFAASSAEYQDLLLSVGRRVDMLVVKDDGFERLIFVVR